MNKCKGSGLQRHVSDYNVYNKTAQCPICKQTVKITIPNKKLHSNTAKFGSHSIKG